MSVLLSPYMLLRASLPDSVAGNVPHYSPASEEWSLPVGSTAGARTGGRVTVAMRFNFADE